MVSNTVTAPSTMALITAACSGTNWLELCTNPIARPAIGISNKPEEAPVRTVCPNNTELMLTPNHLAAQRTATSTIMTGAKATSSAKCKLAPANTNKTIKNSSKALPNSSADTTSLRSILRTMIPTTSGAKSADSFNCWASPRHNIKAPTTSASLY